MSAAAVNARSSSSINREDDEYRSESYVSSFADSESAPKPRDGTTEGSFTCSSSVSQLGISKSTMVWSSADASSGVTTEVTTPVVVAPSRPHRPARCRYDAEAEGASSE